MYLVCLRQNALLLFCLLAKSFYLRNCIEFLHCHMYTNYYKKNKNKIWLDREERWYKNNKTKGEINIFLLFSLLLIRIELHNVYLFIHDFTNFARYVMSENTAVVHEHDFISFIKGIFNYKITSKNAQDILCILKKKSENKKIQKANVRYYY